MSFLWGGGAQKTDRKNQFASESTLGNIAGDMSARGKSDLGTGEKMLQAPANFWQTLLSGDRTAMTSTLAPEISTVSSQYQAARKAASEFSPRGGGRTSDLSESRFKEGGDIQKLFEQGRVTAADKVTDISKIYSALGLSETGTAAGAAGTQGQVATAARGQSMQQAQQQGQAAGQLFSLLVGMV